MALPGKISSRLPEKLNDNIRQAFGAAVRLTGAMDVTSLRRLKSATDALERSLRNYDKVAERLVSSTPIKDQLEKVIQDRVPGEYRNKAYKRLFWRTVYRVVPFMQKKRKTEDQINAVSRLALASFSVIFRSIVGASKSLISQSAPEDVDGEDLEEKDPEEFDPELESAILGIEKEVKPSEGKDQVQRKTDTNFKNQQRRSKQTSSAKDAEEFRSFVGLHEAKVDNSRVAVTRQKSELTECLVYSTDAVFSLIRNSSLKAVALAEALNVAAASSRDALQPGTYIACKSLLAAIMATNTIVIQSVALNRAQRAQLNKELKALQKATEQRSEGQEVAEE